jgi:hypothetical protein
MLSVILLVVRTKPGMVNVIVPNVIMLSVEAAFRLVFTKILRNSKQLLMSFLTITHELLKNFL